MDPDRDSIERCKDGCREAQQQLYLQTMDRLYRFMLRMVGNPEDAFDITQNTYLRAFRAIGEFRGHSTVTTWLIRIAMNEVLQFRRRKRVESRYPQVMPRGDPSDESVTDSVASSMDVDAALTGLEPEDRAILLFRYDQGLSYREIALALDCAEGTVASRLSRARAKLREILGDSYAGREEYSRAEHPSKWKGKLDEDSPPAHEEDLARHRMKATDR